MIRIKDFYYQGELVLRSPDFNTDAFLKYHYFLVTFSLKIKEDTLRHNGSVLCGMSSRRAVGWGGSGGMFICVSGKGAATVVTLKVQFVDTGRCPKAF